MTADAWVAIGSRHIWYKNLLKERMAQRPDKQILDLRLTDRMRRHQARMDRHLLRALPLVETSDTQH
jgi:hypothetical protein